MDSQCLKHDLCYVTTNIVTFSSIRHFGSSITEQHQSDMRNRKLSALKLFPTLDLGSQMIFSIVVYRG